MQIIFLRLVHDDLIHDGHRCTRRARMRTCCTEKRIRTFFCPFRLRALREIRAFHDSSNIDLFIKPSSSFIELIILLLEELLQSFVTDFFQNLSGKFLAIPCDTSQTESSRIEQTTIDMNTDRTRTHWTRSANDQRGDFAVVFLVRIFHSHEWIAKEIDFLQQIDGQRWGRFLLGVRCGRWRNDCGNRLVDVCRIIPIIGRVKWTQRALKHFRFNEFFFGHLKRKTRIILEMKILLQRLITGNQPDALMQ